MACALRSAWHYDVTITGAGGARAGGDDEDAPPERPARGGRAGAPTRPLPPEVCRCGPLLHLTGSDIFWAEMSGVLGFPEIFVVI